MSLTINLWSRKAGDLKRFLESYYSTQIDVNENDSSWTCELKKPLDAADFISAVIDNGDRFQIAVYIQFGNGNLYHVTEDNYNNVIRDIFMLFYNTGVCNCN